MTVSTTADLVEKDLSAVLGELDPGLRPVSAEERRSDLRFPTRARRP